MLILSELWPRNNFFLVVTKKRNCSFMTKKLFFRSDQKIELFILSELLPKDDFFLVITKKSPFSRSVDIERVMTKKRFFKVILK